MQIIAIILTAIVAIEHLYILWMEMFAWETAGKRHLDELYLMNYSDLPKDWLPIRGFTMVLAAGLVWSFFIENPEWSINIRIFFLGCVAVAGIFGAVTASKRYFCTGIASIISACICTAFKIKLFIILFSLVKVSNFDKAFLMVFSIIK